jgi:phage terminase large subunit-like protein
MSARVGVSHRVTRYATDVLAGRVVVGPFVRLACERHLRDLKRWRSTPKKSLPFWFDEAAATRAIDFFERELVLPDMLDDDGECMPFKLSPWQAFIVGSLFGWKQASPFIAWWQTASGIQRCIARRSRRSRPRSRGPTLSGWCGMRPG